MTVKIDEIEPNIFPAVEGIDARQAEVIFGIKIEGKLVPVTVKLSYEQANALGELLDPFRKDEVAD
jgi:hypothetical protein